MFALLPKVNIILAVSNITAFLSALKYLSIILAVAFPSLAVVKLPDVRSGVGNMTKYWQSEDKNGSHFA